MQQGSHTARGWAAEGWSDLHPPSLYYGFSREKPSKAVYACPVQYWRPPARPSCWHDVLLGCHLRRPISLLVGRLSWRVDVCGAWIMTCLQSVSMLPQSALTAVSVCTIWTWKWSLTLGLDVVLASNSFRRQEQCWVPFPWRWDIFVSCDQTYPALDCGMRTSQMLVNSPMRLNTRSSRSALRVDTDNMIV